jgi:hypothetical protein
VLSLTFLATNAYIKNTERFQINDLMLHLKLLVKQEQAKPKTTRRKIMKIRITINEINKHTHKHTRTHTHTHTHTHTKNQGNKKLVL